MNQFSNGRAMAQCPRCKKYALDLTDYAESGIYRSQHLICVPCFHQEEKQIDDAGTNHLPDTLKEYGPPNDFPMGDE